MARNRGREVEKRRREGEEWSRGEEWRWGEGEQMMKGIEE